MKKAVNVLVSLALLVAVSGCTAAILGGKAGTNLNAPVQEVYNAALEQVQEANMPVLKKQAAAGAASIRAEYADGTPVWINIEKVSPEYSRINVRVDRFGNDYRAYRLLQNIEDRLGR